MRISFIKIQKLKIKTQNFVKYNTILNLLQFVSPIMRIFAH